jgi:hypothetical protein
MLKKQKLAQEAKAQFQNSSAIPRPPQLTSPVVSQMPGSNPNQSNTQGTNLNNSTNQYKNNSNQNQGSSGNPNVNQTNYRQIPLNQQQQAGGSYKPQQNQPPQQNYQMSSQQQQQQRQSFQPGNQQNNPYVQPPQTGPQFQRERIPESAWPKKIELATKELNSDNPKKVINGLNTLLMKSFESDVGVTIQIENYPDLIIALGTLSFLIEELMLFMELLQFMKLM